MEQIALHPAEEKYRSIFENAVEGMFQRTPDGRYLLANPALARMYGYESSAHLLMDLTDIDRQYVDQERHQQFIEILQQNEQVCGFESQVYRQDGSIIWISESARAVRDQNGVLIYCEGFVREIQQRKSTEEKWLQLAEKYQQQSEKLQATLEKLHKMEFQLIHSEKMSSIGQMVAGVAHEINNPVTFVCGNLLHASQYAEDLLNLLKLYQQHYPQPAPEIEEEIEALDLDFMMVDFRKTLSSMQMGADRIRQIVHSLRNFSRMDEAQMKPANIHEGIDSTLLILNNRTKPKGQNPGVTIIKKYGELPLVKCYGELLNQVFMNLLSNAIDALEEYNQIRLENHLELNPSTITISTEIINFEWAGIKIADNGAGMPEKVKEQIFNSFFTTKPLGKGTGLGLSISHQIVVEKHCGNLKCNSTPDLGTEFIIEIPLNT
ncbi:MAG: ATP-binding protein [Crinalium sp.]